MHFERMKFVSLFILIVAFSSCVPSKEILIRSDGTAKVLQHYTVLNPRDQWEINGLFDKEKEKLDYSSPIISDFENVYEYQFSFNIKPIDSLGSYLNGIPKDFIEFRMIGDSILYIVTKTLNERPDRNGYVTFILNFENEIMNVATSQKIRCFWNQKKYPRQLIFDISPKKLWKKKRTHLIAVEIK